LTQAELLQQIYRVTRSVAVGGRLAATPVFAIRAKANVTSLQVAVCARSGNVGTEYEYVWIENSTWREGGKRKKVKLGRECDSGMQREIQ